MPLSLPRVIKAAVLMLVSAIAAGWPTGDDVAQAETANRPQAIQYPWAGTDDEIVVNLAIGSLRDSLMMWLTSERGVHADTLLVSIGAIAGFAAQRAVEERIKDSRRDHCMRSCYHGTSVPVRCMNNSRGELPEFDFARRGGPLDRTRNLGSEMTFSSNYHPAPSS